MTDTYDAGVLSDAGGGDVDWWQDYIRAELDRAHDFYADQLELTELDVEFWKSLATRPFRPLAEIASLRADTVPRDVVRGILKELAEDGFIETEHDHQTLAICPHCWSFRQDDGSCDHDPDCLKVRAEAALSTRPPRR